MRFGFGLRKLSDMETPESPIDQWGGYKLAAYGKTPLSPDQEKECSECFYAGMMAGTTTSVEIFKSYKGARRYKEMIGFVKKIKLIALASNPTGKN